MKNQKANYKPPGHQLYVTRPGVLLKIFSKNKVSKGKRGMMFRVFFFSFLSWPFQLIQRVIFWFNLRKINLNEKPPVFILGHWRSGTTHIHYLLSKDPQFGFLSNFQSFFFNICTVGLGWFDRLISPHTAQVRPMDKMDFTVMAPSEEEQVLSNMSELSNVYSIYFPDNSSYFDKFLMFEGISDSEKKKWQKAYTYVLKSIAFMSGGKRLVVKNPSNTARIKQILELYPNAKFVYIYRNPFSVYLSTLHLSRVVWEGQSFQDMTEADYKDVIIENYKKVMKAYLRDKSLIPKDNLIEVSYDEIGEGSEKIFSKIYKSLNLDSHDEALPHVKAYLKTIKGYEKNEFIPIEEDMVKRIQAEWKFAFEEYGYDLEYCNLVKSEL
ncbi:sulfotransferase [Aureispira]|nr:sulfotransferase [Aureispira sp.]